MARLTAHNDVTRRTPDSHGLLTDVGTFSEVRLAERHVFGEERAKVLRNFSTAGWGAWWEPDRSLVGGFTSPSWGGVKRWSELHI